MKALLITIASTAALVLLVSAESNSAHTCIPGKSFKIDCNSCGCNKNGTPGPCTEIACDIPTKCINGSMKQSGCCDTCICRDGQWYCYTSPKNCIRDGIIDPCPGTKELWCVDSIIKIFLNFYNISFWLHSNTVTTGHWSQTDPSQYSTSTSTDG